MPIWGFIWVGTQGGLHRYDGQRYLRYRHDPVAPGSLPDNYVTALAAQGDDTLWVGTYAQYVVRLNPATGATRRYDTSGGSTGQRQVMALLPHGGTLWVGTLAGLERLDPQSGARTRVVNLDTRLLRSGPSQALVSGTDGIWYGSAAGLYRVDARQRVTRLPYDIAVRSLAHDHRGRLWVGTSNGLYRLANDGHTLERSWPSTEVPGEPATAEIRAIVEAPDRYLWLSLGTRGLLRLDPASGAVRRLNEQQGLPAGLPEVGINTLMVDCGGMLWAGGQFRGAAVTDPRGTRFSYVLGLGSRDPNPTSEDSVRSLAQDASGALWIGTDDARLLQYDLALGRFENATALLPPGPGAGRRRVMAIRRAGTDRLWLATSGGLLRMDPATRQVESVDLGRHSGASMRSLMIDHGGNVWLGTSSDGLLRYSPTLGAVKHYGYRDDDPNQLSHPTVHAVLEDTQRRIWIGTGAGLDLLEPATGRLRHFRQGTNAPGNLIRALWQSPDGTIWIGTHAGLSRVIESADGRISLAHPLAEALRERTVPVVFSITEAPAGMLWLGTDNGIVRFDTRSERYRFYGLADGLQDLEFNGGAVARLADGRLAFGGVRGFNLHLPVGAKPTEFAPPLRLLSVQVGADAPGENGSPWLPQQLQVPDGAGLLRLRIGALDYAPSADIQYRYRLDGFDLGWINNGRQQDITYTQLPPGDYRFRAQASNRDGVWSREELEIPVRVLPPWWRHPGVVTLAALSVLALIAGLAWRRHLGIRRERSFFAAIREREERLKLALWGSGEVFWDYDFRTCQMHAMRIDEHGMQQADSGVQMEAVVGHDVHPDDWPRLRELLREHLRGNTPNLLSEHRVRLPDGQWAWVLARGRVVERDDDGG